MSKQPNNNDRTSKRTSRSRPKKAATQKTDSAVAMSATDDHNLPTEGGTAPSESLEAGLDTEKVSNASSGSLMKMVVGVAAVAVVGIGVGLGVSLLSGTSPAPDKPSDLVVGATTSDGKTGDNKGIEFDDDLRNWNVQAAPYISPLVSQLARTTRTTLGGQVQLCTEQSDTLAGVLALPLPPDAKVADAFDAWRKALKSALDDCVNVKPSGDDERDIKRLMAEINDTEALFGAFLTSMKPRVNVSFDANPDMFEKR